jgi:GH35 family endo-1,4-beta-xylanase
MPRRPIARNTRLGLEQLELREVLSAGTGLLAQFYDNPDLTALATTRTEPVLNDQWSPGTSPAPGVGTAGYSVRWSGQVEAQYTETYTFTVTADQTVRLWVDGQELVNAHGGNTPTGYSGTLALVAGRRYDIEVEYQNPVGGGQVKLEWSSASQVQQVIPVGQLFPSQRGGLLREVWTNVPGTQLSDLTNSPNYATTANAASVVAAAAVTDDVGANYGERLSGTVYAPVSGYYRFTLNTSDAAALYLSNSTDPSGEQLIAQSSGAGATSAPIYLVAGQGYYLQALHKVATGSAGMSIGWSRPDGLTEERITGDDLAPVVPQVQLYAQTDIAVRGAAQQAVFQVVRTGGSLALPVTVNYTVSGTAVANTDYTALPGSVTIPAGQDSATIVITGLPSAVATGTKTVSVELQSGPGYDVGLISERTAQASILDNVAAPAGGTSVINPALSSFFTSGSQYGNTQVVSDPTYGQALQINVTTVAPNIYNFLVGQAITSAVNAGDRLLVQFYARSTSATNAKFDVVFEQNSSPFTRSITQSVQMDGNWTKYQIPVTVAANYAAGAAQLDFQLGSLLQSVQLANIQVLDYGPAADLLQGSTPSVVQSGGSWGSGSTVAAAGPGFTSALQVNTTTVPPNSYQIQGVVKNAAPVLAGDTLTATYYLRSTGPGNATVNTIVQQASGSFTTLGGRTDTVGTTWTQYTLTVAASSTYAVNGLQLAFNSGYGPQSVQIGGITWTRTGAGISTAAIPATSTAALTVFGASNGTTQLVSVSGAPGFSHAFQAVTTTVPANSFNYQAATRSVNAIAAGTVVSIQFYARATGTSGTAKFDTTLQATDNFQTFLFNTTTVGTNWTLVTATATVSRAIPAGTLQFALDLGYGPQTVQFGGIQISVPAGNPLLFQTDDLAELSLVGSPTYGTASYAPFNTATNIFSPLQVQTTTQPTNAFSFQSVAKTSRAVSAGDTLNLVFYARNVGSTTGMIDAIVQQSSGSFSSLLFQRITLTSNWTQYSYAIPVTQAYAAGALQLAFDYGFAPQTIQLGGVLLTDASPAPAPVVTLPSLIPDVTYGGRSGTDAWRTTADTSIDQTREANVNVQVVDQFGRPVNGAVVSVQQTAQAFKFGTAATATYLTPTATDPTSLKYQSILQRLFNSATIDNALKWPDFLSNPQLGIDAANWIKSHGLYLRGHNIIWPSRSNMPSSIWSQYDSINSSQGATAAANYLESAILARIQSAMSTFDGQAGEWDVVNEPYTNNDAMAVLGNSIVTAWYQAAAAADPDALRVLNDYDIFENNGQNSAHVANFNQWLNQLTSAGVLNEIGEQSHYTESNLTNISTFGSLLNTYSAYGLPIAITEFDLSTLDNQLQADYLRDYMTMAFSNPSVSEFTQWGFWTGDEWRPNIGLFNTDWSIKPDGQAYEDLVYGNWWTDVRGTSDWGGQYSTRAFQGQYQVTVNYNGQTIVVPATLGADGLTLTVPVTVPLSATSSTVSAPDITYGADGNVKVAVNSPDGTPTGIVSLTVDGTQTFSHALVGGSWTFDIPGLTAGDHSLVSTFLTQGPFAGSTATGSLHVNPAVLTVTADNQSMVYGATMPTLTASYSGFVNGDTAADLSGAPDLTTVPASSHVGSYAITADTGTLADSNYTFGFDSGTLTVTPAALTITADNQSMDYGGTMPTLTASYAGLVNDDTPSVIAGLTLATVPANSHVGSYAITPAGGTDPDYTITLVGGTLTITPVALTAQVNNATKAYGSPNPAFSVSYTGLVNGDTAAALGGSPSYSTNATATSGVGSYAVTVSGLTSSDYTISYAPGTLTVIPATLVTSSVPVAAYAGAPLVGATVATFDNPNPTDTASSYTATIFWGDGSSSAGTITANGSGGFTVTGSHTYADPASYTLSVQISHVLGYTTPATVSGTATVTALGTGPSANQLAGIGFWHNQAGQALIKSFNVGPNSTALASWLATTFPNLYGAAAGSHNLTGMSNTQVAAFYLVLWGQSGAKTDLQVLATALNVYTTTTSLGGSAGVAYGFQVTATGLGAASVNVGQDGTAVSVANGTTLNVYELLVAVNKKAANGVLYAGNTQLTNEAKDLFGSLNGAGGN